jgi:hypothetical protein
MNAAERLDADNIFVTLSATEFYDAFGIRLLPGDWEASVEWFRSEMTSTDDPNEDIDPVAVLKALRDRRQLQMAVDAIDEVT